LFRSCRTLFSSVLSPQPSLVNPLTAQVSKVVFQVTILPALLDPLQQAIAKSCGKVVDILGVEQVSRSQTIRVRFGIDGVSVNAVMEAIIRALPSGEIGRIVAL
jgi:hypothetical protein